MSEFLRQMFLFTGGATAVVAVVLIWGILLSEIWREAASLGKHHIQSRKDAKLFTQVEEFRRDFS